MSLVLQLPARPLTVDDLDDFPLGDNDITIAQPFIVTLNPARLAIP